MKKSVKNILKKLGLYYFLQGNYRNILSHAKQINYKIQYAKYRGAGFECNCCGATYKKFVPDYPAAENVNAINTNKVIAGYGENVLCPACLSTARERLIIALLKNEINITGKKVLHFSPEKNIYNFIKQHNEVVTADIEPLFYKIIDDKIKNEDATRLSFADNSFDVIIGNHIMEHIPDDEKALQEMYRVLKSGGMAILQVPYSTTIYNTLETLQINDPQKQAAWYGQKDHVRIYALQDYVSRLRKAGFKVELIEYGKLNAYYKNAIQPHEVFLSILK